MCKMLPFVIVCIALLCSTPSTHSVLAFSLEEELLPSLDFVLNDGSDTWVTFLSLFYAVLPIAVIVLWVACKPVAKNMFWCENKVLTTQARQPKKPKKRRRQGKRNKTLRRKSCTSEDAPKGSELYLASKQFESIRSRRSSSGSVSMKSFDSVDSAGEDKGMGLVGVHGNRTVDKGVVSNSSISGPVIRDLGCAITAKIEPVEPSSDRKLGPSTIVKSGCAETSRNNKLKSTLHARNVKLESVEPACNDNSMLSTKIKVEVAKPDRMTVNQLRNCAQTDTQPDCPKKLASPPGLNGNPSCVVTSTNGAQAMMHPNQPRTRTLNGHNSRHANKADSLNKFEQSTADFNKVGKGLRFQTVPHAALVSKQQQRVSTVSPRNAIKQHPSNVSPGNPTKQQQQSNVSPRNATRQHPGYMSPGNPTKQQPRNMSPRNPTKQHPSNMSPGNPTKQQPTKAPSRMRSKQHLINVPPGTHAKPVQQHSVTQSPGAAAREQLKHPQSTISYGMTHKQQQYNPSTVDAGVRREQKPFKGSSQQKPFKGSLQQKPFKGSLQHGRADSYFKKLPSPRNLKVPLKSGGHGNGFESSFHQHQVMTGTPRGSDDSSLSRPLKFPPLMATQRVNPAMYTQTNRVASATSPGIEHELGPTAQFPPLEQSSNSTYRMNHFSTPDKRVTGFDATELHESSFKETQESSLNSSWNTSSSKEVAASPLYHVSSPFHTRRTMAFPSVAWSSQSTSGNLGSVEDTHSSMSYQPEIEQEPIDDSYALTESLLRCLSLSDVKEDRQMQQ